MIAYRIKLPGIISFTAICLLGLFILFAGGAAAQTKDKKKVSAQRENQRKGMHQREALLRSVNKSDTSINSLLQRVEHYTTIFNQVKNDLSEGLDTVEVSQELPRLVKRIDKINTLANMHKSSTLRYLFVLRDNLDRMQGRFEGWQSDLDDVSSKLIQNQRDLLKFPNDTLLKTVPSDSVVRKSFFAHRRALWKLWHATDSVNRSALLKVNLLQDKTSVSYTKILDESDQIDSKIKSFAVKALEGESDYIWNADVKKDHFESALGSTTRLHQILFGYFLKNETATHYIGFLFLALVFGWLLFNRSRALRHCDDTVNLTDKSPFVCKKPVASGLLLTTAICPYFYSHPPTVFLEACLLLSIILSLIIIRSDVLKPTYNFLITLFGLTVFYGISNLFIEISTIDRFVIVLLGIAAIAISIRYLKKVKKAPENHLPYSGLVLKVFMILEILSVLLNISGRFSLAKIVGTTAVFNLWLLVIFFLVVNILMQGVFLHLKVKRSDKHILNWIDYDLVQAKVTKGLTVVVALLWLFTLLQNLNIDDAAEDYAGGLFNQSRSIGGASFTFGGFVIFILVIWLSSVVSRIISYFYDVSAQRVTELSVLQKKNRTSALIIRMGVFAAGFLLAVAASGFPLDKLTIIISAFGVGIGFGLQNIVNNLVSGLILAFEKPIQIGDVVEIDGHTGTMKEIGIRSSRVVTGDGSEVIIPNGDLISRQVVNWTLSNSNRQIELRVITAYGIEIGKVKELLKAILVDRDDIMASPVPSVFVNNVTETAVEFKLLFWEADISTTSEMKSRILSEVYQAMIKEGVPMPSPQKDFYLHFPEGVPLNSTDQKK